MSRSFRRISAPLRPRTNPFALPASLSSVAAPPQSATPQSGLPQSATPPSALPQSATPPSALPQSATQKFSPPKSPAAVSGLSESAPPVGNAKSGCPSGWRTLAEGLISLASEREVDRRPSRPRWCSAATLSRRGEEGPRGGDGRPFFTTLSRAESSLTGRGGRFSYPASRGRAVCATALLVGALVIIAGLSRADALTLRRGPVSSRECKILLKVERFNDLAAGLQEFWGLVEAAARRAGLAVSANGPFPGPEKTRHVAFYDTPGFDLYRLGYILRRRGDTANDVTPARNADSQRFDLTLKYRNPELQLSQMSTIQAAHSFNGETKVEEDVVAGPATIRKVYSLSSKVKLKKDPGPRLRDFFAIYPGLPRLGLDQTLAVRPVRDTLVREYTISPGRIDLDGATVADVTFSVWTIPPAKQPSVVEFSFAYDVVQGGYLNQKVYRAQEAADRLLKAIQGAGSAWIATGQTKTGLIYQIEVPNGE